MSTGAYYEDQKVEAKRRARDFIDARIPKYLGWFDEVLARNGGTQGWLVGRKLTYADLSLFQVVEGWTALRISEGDEAPPCPRSRAWPSSTSASRSVRASPLILPPSAASRSTRTASSGITPSSTRDRRRGLACMRCTCEGWKACGASLRSFSCLAAAGVTLRMMAPSTRHRHVARRCPKRVWLRPRAALFAACWRAVCGPGKECPTPRRLSVNCAGVLPHEADPALRRERRDRVRQQLLTAGRQHRGPRRWRGLSHAQCVGSEHAGSARRHGLLARGQRLRGRELRSEWQRRLRQHRAGRRRLGGGRHHQLPPRAFGYLASLAAEDPNGSTSATTARRTDRRVDLGPRQHRCLRR